MTQNPLLRLTGVLALALVILGGLSLLWRDGVPLWGDATLKTCGVGRALLGETPVAPVATADESVPVDSGGAAPAPAAVPAAARPAQPDTTAKTILFVGDSMLDGLQPRMAAYAEHNGHKLYGVRWYSSTTQVWGSSQRLAGFIKQYKPDYVIVCLGANELFVRDIKEKRQRYLDEMLRQIGSLPMVWIGPPNWKADTGINEMLEATLPRGTFYLSKNDKFERGKDGAHPTRESAAQWCDRVCRWIVAESAHPIRLDVPKKKYANSTKTDILQPNEK